MLIYITRHGESVDDLTGHYGGATNWNLTEEGERQAALAGSRLQVEGVQAIYASPMERARKSAEIIQSVLGGVPLSTVFDLRERNTYGLLSGLTPDEAEKLFGYLVAETQKVAGVGNACAPGGEEYPEFIARVKRAFDYVVQDAREAGYERIAIVTHGKFTLGLFRDVLNISDEYDKSLASINIIEYIPPRLVSPMNRNV